MSFLHPQSSIRRWTTAGLLAVYLWASIFSALAHHHGACCGDVACSGHGACSGYGDCCHAFATCHDSRCTNPECSSPECSSCGDPNCTACLEPTSRLDHIAASRVASAEPVDADSAAASVDDWVEQPRPDEGNREAIELALSDDECQSGPTQPLPVESGDCARCRFHSQPPLVVVVEIEIVPTGFVSRVVVDEPISPDREPPALHLARAPPV